MSILSAMAFAERRDSQGGGMMAQLTPVVKWLLILNLGIYFGDMLLFDWRIRNECAFTIQSALFEYRIWEFLSFQFIHGSVGHVLFNCIGLFFFGPWMERWWGAKQFLFFYLVCGAAGAMLYSSLVFAGILPQTIVRHHGGTVLSISPPPHWCRWSVPRRGSTVFWWASR